MSKADRAEELFRSGCACSQAVFCAFAEEMGMDQATAMKVASGLGGGVGRMREVCGAITGAAMAIGLKHGNATGDDAAAKAKTYELIQKVAGRFRAENGSIVCRELLGLAQGAPTPATPDARTPAYYKKRPCAELVHMAAQFVEEELGD